MCLSCGACLVKSILMFVNFVFVVIGLAITAIGIVILVNVQGLDVYVEGTGASAQKLAWIIIVIGCVVTTIFFLGCCGAMTRNTCMLITYSVIIIILGTMTVVVTVLVSNNKETIEEMGSDQLIQLFNQTADSDALHMMESTLGCCGTTGPDSYSNSSIPVTCCPEGVNNIQSVQSSLDGINSINIINDVSSKLTCDITDAYQDGCVTIFLNKLREALKTAEKILIFICIGEYVAAVLAIFLTCYFDRRKLR